MHKFGFDSGLAAIALALALPLMARADDAVPRVSLKGYDTVAYFTDGKPVKGTPRLHYDWDGARYYFASAKHREMFTADPERYAPQFSGLCAAGVSYRKFNEADPTVWRIVDGKLYVFGGPTALEIYEKDPPKVLARSHENWKAARR